MDKAINTNHKWKAKLVCFKFQLEWTNFDNL